MTIFEEIRRLLSSKGFMIKCHPLCDAYIIKRKNMSKKTGPLVRRKSTENAPNSKDKGPKSTGKKDPFSMEQGTKPKPAQGNRK